MTNFYGQMSNKVINVITYVGLNKERNNKDRIADDARSRNNHMDQKIN